MVKNFIKKIPFIKKIFHSLVYFFQNVKFYKRNTVLNESKSKFHLDCDLNCRNNKISIKKDCYFDSSVIRIRGTNNEIIFEEGVKVGKGCSFWMEGNNLKIKVGGGTTFTQYCHLNAQEENVSIILGKDCMLSNHIIIRTSDSHPIYNAETKQRLNNAKSVMIGEHVWIAPDTKIMKGANIGNGCIVGSNTMLNKTFPDNTLIVGMPAKVVKNNVEWTRESLW